MTVLTRYLVREFGKSLIAVAAVLVLIYMSNQVATLLAQVAAGQMASDVVFGLLFLKWVNNLRLVLPPAFFIAVLLTLGRMYSEQEMTVLAACGIGQRRIYRALLLVAVPLTVFMVWLSFFAGPWSTRLANLIQDQAQERADVTGISAGRFKESTRGDVVFYAEKLSHDRRRMQQVFVQSADGGRLGVLIARKGHQYVDAKTGDRYLVLEDGRRYQGEPGQADYRIVRFKEYAVLIEEHAYTPSAQREGALPTAELWHRASAEDMAELHARLASPLGILLLGLLAVPLSPTRPRQGRYGKLFFAIVIYVVYANLAIMAQSWTGRGLLPPMLGLWWVHGLLACLWVVLHLHMNGRLRWRRPARVSAPA